VTIEYIEKHPDKPWNSFGMVLNPNLTMEYVEEHCPDRSRDWWFLLSHNPNLPMEYVAAHPDEPWIWYGIAANAALTMDFVEKHPDKLWNWVRISQNANVTIEYIDTHPEKRWDWVGISQNPNLTIEFVREHPDKPWNWYEMSRNLFSLHPAMKKRLPTISDEQRVLLQELRQKFDMPPMVDQRPVFRKGGVGYWEGWNMVKELKRL